MFQMFGRDQIASLDNPLAKYCSGFSMMTEYNITLRQMAAQVSGYCSICILLCDACGASERSLSKLKLRIRVP